MERTAVRSSHLKSPRQHGQSQGGREHRAVRGGPGSRLGPGTPGRRCEAPGIHRDRRDRGPAQRDDEQGEGAGGGCPHAAYRPAVQTEPARTARPLDRPPRLDGVVEPLERRRRGHDDPGRETQPLGKVVAEWLGSMVAVSSAAGSTIDEHAEAGTERLVEVTPSVQPGRDHDRRRRDRAEAEPPERAAPSVHQPTQRDELTRPRSGPVRTSRTAVRPTTGSRQAASRDSGPTAVLMARLRSACAGCRCCRRGRAWGPPRRASRRPTAEPAAAGGPARRRPRPRSAVLPDGRLVERRGDRAVCERGRDHQPSLLTAGEVVGAGVGEVAQTEQRRAVRRPAASSQAGSRPTACPETRPRRALAW